MNSRRVVDGQRARRRGRQRLATLMAAALLAHAGCRPDAPELAPTGDEPSGSFFAVGDTGSVWGALPEVFEGQLAVGAAMQRAHLRRPIDALILLGDNFYPNGLLASELESRVVQNLARPYCAFVDASEELIALLGEACERVRDPIPRLLAIAGNHDLRSPESLDLQRRALPRFVRNWEMPFEDGPVVRELPGGMSLVLLVSEWPWDEANATRLAAALRSARGPWRIIVGHRPPITGHPQLSKMVAQASLESGRVVHAYLAGHVHGLAAIRGEAPNPSLTLIAGSGSHAKLQTQPEYRIDHADVMAEKLGFVRVDAIGDGTSERLRVSLLAAPPSALLAFLGTRTMAQYDVHLDGSVERRD